MKFGVREICDVVFKAKANQKVGNKIFYKNEPVIYFDTLKTSSLEGAATTVYAQGGRGNARLMAWEGERTLTFTMEDALISPVGFSILSGAGLIEADTDNKIKVHTTERVKINSVVTDDEQTTVTIKLSEAPYDPSDKHDYIYVMFLDDKGEVASEPYIPSAVTVNEQGNTITLTATWKDGVTNVDRSNDFKTDFVPTTETVVLVDYYVERSSNVSEITITPDKFGGYYYVEASTLFRNTDGVDMPAEFVIPNCKIQSNFTFAMSSTGDPSTFTFTLDAFPDYTRFDLSKKVLATLQVITGSETQEELVRVDSPSQHIADENGFIVEKPEET